MLVAVLVSELTCHSQRSRPSEPVSVPCSCHLKSSIVSPSAPHWFTYVHVFVNTEFWSNAPRTEHRQRSTFELLGIAQQELVGMLHLQVKLNGLQQDALQHHHLLLLGEKDSSFIRKTSSAFHRQVKFQSAGGLSVV